MLEAASGMAAGLGDLASAMRFHAAADAEAQRLRVKRDPADQAFVDWVDHVLRSGLAEEFDSAREASRDLSYRATVAHMRNWLTSLAPS